MTPTRATELQRLHEATVAEEEIDHLGHMNVRYYHEKALAASETLAAAHGLGAGMCRRVGAVLELRETFTRHYREQLAGARLEVRGGLLAVRGDGLRAYHELVNVEGDERAATFVHDLALREVATRRPLPLPEMVARSAGGALVAWPEHGRPRTLDLDRVPPTPSLDELRRRGLASRKERVLGPESCGADGIFPAARIQELFWGGEPARANELGPVLRPLPDGGQLGWATLESRALWHAPARLGTRIQSFSAEVEIAGKVTVHHMWVHDVERGTPLCTGSVVNLAFDVSRRRAVAIPPDVRDILEARYHPDLR